MRNGDDVLGAGTDAAARITVSWKAEVHANEAEAARAQDLAGPLTLARVVDTFLADLRHRGVETATPDDPHHDPAWVRALSDAYRTPGPRVPR